MFLALEFQFQEDSYNDKIAAYMWLSWYNLNLKFPVQLLLQCNQGFCPIASA